MRRLILLASLLAACSKAPPAEPATRYVALDFTEALAREPRPEPPSPSRGGIYAKVAQDAADQYGIVIRQGDPQMACMQAGQTAQAYLQAKDEEAYNRWKATEATDCAVVQAQGEARWGK